MRNDFDGDENMRNDFGGDENWDLDEYFNGNMEPEGSELVEMMHIELATAALNHEILKTVISSLEKDFFWKFRSPDAKLRMIEAVYKKMDRLIQHTEN